MDLRRKVVQQAGAMAAEVVAGREMLAALLAADQPIGAVLPLRVVGPRRVEPRQPQVRLA
jgi:hypothetical protein